MANVLSRQRTWVGFFAKKTEDAFIAGTDKYDGMMFRMDDPSHNILTFTSENLRLGAGVGGVFSFGIIIFFNVGYNLGWVEGQSLGHGWSLGTDLPVGYPAKIRTVLKGIKAIKDFHEMAMQIVELMSLADQLWETSYQANSNPIIHVATETSMSMSLGLMRSFSGKIDIKIVRGKGGIIYNF
ncbi:hypothetical protein [Spirosoma fluminis]